MNFNKSNLANSNFEDANLSGTYFTDTIMTKINLLRTNLDNVYVDDVDWLDNLDNYKVIGTSIVKAKYEVDTTKDKTINGKTHYRIKRQKRQKRLAYETFAEQKHLSENYKEVLNMLYNKLGLDSERKLQLPGFEQEVTYLNEQDICEGFKMKVKRSDGKECIAILEQDFKKEYLSYHHVLKFTFVDKKDDPLPGWRSYIFKIKPTSGRDKTVLETMVINRCDYYELQVEGKIFSESDKNKYYINKFLSDTTWKPRTWEEFKIAYLSGLCRLSFFHTTKKWAFDNGWIDTKERNIKNKYGLDVEYHWKRDFYKVLLYSNEENFWRALRESGIDLYYLNPFSLR